MVITPIFLCVNKLEGSCVVQPSHLYSSAHPDAASEATFRVAGAYEPHADRSDFECVASLPVIGIVTLSGICSSIFCIITASRRCVVAAEAGNIWVVKNICAAVKYSITISGIRKWYYRLKYG